MLDLQLEPLAEQTKNGTATLLARKQESVGSSDHFQTPAWAVNPLLEVIPRSWRVWEPACGKGNIVRAFEAAGFEAFGTDIISGNDFLRIQPARYDVIVTNPPYTLKDQFIARCYELGKPFALLLPFTALEGQKRQPLYRKHGVNLILLPRRVNFETPSGEGGGAWFPVAFFTWGIPLPSPLWFWEDK